MKVNIGVAKGSDVYDQLRILLGKSNIHQGSKEIPIKSPKMILRAKNNLCDKINHILHLELP